MRRHLFKGATLAAAIGFIIFAAVAAGGGPGKRKGQAVTPDAAKPAAADAGVQDAGATVESVFGGPEYFPASKSPGGMFLRGDRGAGGLGIGTVKPKTEKKPEPQAAEQAPQR